MDSVYVMNSAFGAVVALSLGAASVGHVHLKTG